jgi:hypothetical protein
MTPRKRDLVAGQFEKNKNAAATALVYVAGILDVTIGAQAGMPVPLSS